MFGSVCLFDISCNVVERTLGRAHNNVIVLETPGSMLQTNLCSHKKWI